MASYGKSNKGFRIAAENRIRRSADNEGVIRSLVFHNPGFTYEDYFTYMKRIKHTPLAKSTFQKYARDERAGRPLRQDR